MHRKAIPAAEKEMSCSRESCTIGMAAVACWSFAVRRARGRRRVGEGQEEGLSFYFFYRQGGKGEGRAASDVGVVVVGEVVLVKVLVEVEVM